MDLSKLMKSITKYERAGVPAEKMPFWNGLQQTLETISANAQQHKVWNLEEIKKLVTHTTTMQNNNHISPLSVPQVLVPLLEKDTAAIPEVNALIISNDRLITHLQNI